MKLQKDQMRELLFFDNLITVPVIHLLYWFSLLASAVWGVVSLLRAESLMQVVQVLVMFAMAVLAWRIMCEVCIVIFGIYTRLGEIHDTLAKGPRSGDEPKPRSRR
ncbi:hypothetical protein FACS1894186_0210 [Alphaproteobacteria bacterium]|nr:hypothetical protein FACS1894186_0210 [Alphaproteobacteria bacterium]